jgi:hypothetical protein
MSHKSKQILYYSPTIWSNTDFYRTTGVLPFINHPELILRDISHFGKINQWDIDGNDVIIIQRPGTPKGLELIQLAKNVGVKVILDYDDIVLDVDKYNPTYIQYQQQRPIILECIRLADEIWCSTKGVQESFGRGIVIPNGLNTQLVGECFEANLDSNKIVWRGGFSHEADIYEKADEVVALVNSNPELDFYFIGHRFTYLEQRCGDNYTSVDQMPIMQYFRFLRDLKPRAMIFPLCDNIFNRSKSNISFIEATLSGASYFGNKNLPEFDLPCLNDLSDFPNGNHHTEALKYVEENLLLSKINELRIESLLSL